MTSVKIPVNAYHSPMILNRLPCLNEASRARVMSTEKI
jgi:hypothetical protein